MTEIAAWCSAGQVRQSPQSAAWPSPEARAARSSRSHRQAASSRHRERASSSGVGPGSARWTSSSRMQRSIAVREAVGSASSCDQELAAPLRRGVRRLDPGRQAEGLHQGLPEPRPSAAREEVGEDVERGDVGVAAGHGAPAQQAPRHAVGLGQHEVATTRLARLGGFRTGASRRSRRDVAEDRGDPVDGAIGVHVPDHDEHGAIGAVVLAVEAGEVVGADPRGVLGPAEDRVAVGMAQVRDSQMVLVEPALRRIELPGPLLADHPALELDLAGVEPGVTDAIGLDRQGELPAVGREGEPVVRAVLAGLGVALAGRRRDQSIDLALREPLRPLEEHVLDEVRQARQARRLVERTHRIIKVDHHDRRPAPGQDQDLQAVVEPSLGDRQVELAGGREAGLQSSGHGCPSRSVGSGWMIRVRPRGG